MKLNRIPLRTLKITLSSLVAAGVLLYLIPALWLSFSPQTLEQAAFGFLKNRVQESLREEIDRMCSTSEEQLQEMEALAEELSATAQRWEPDGQQQEGQEGLEMLDTLLDNLARTARTHTATVRAVQEEALCDELKTTMMRAVEQTGSPVNFVGNVMAQVNFPENSLVGNWAGRRLAKVGNVLAELWQSISDRLLREIRMFLWINASAYLLVMILSLVRPDRTRELFFPAILLMLASALTTVIYLFGQNWFYTILFEQYWGWFTAGVLSLIFLSLCDITGNEARLTRMVLRLASPV